MKKPFLCTIVLVAFGLIFLGLAGQAQATLLDPVGPFNGNDSLEDMAKELGYYDEGTNTVDDIFVRFNKFEWNQGLNSYVFEPGFDFPEPDYDVGDNNAQVNSANVSWDLSGYPGYQMLAIVVKAGTQWRYYPVSEDQWIIGSGTVSSPNNNAISHFSGYGTVPEPMSMLLMGAGLITWGVVRRRRRQKRAE